MHNDDSNTATVKTSGWKRWGVWVVAGILIATVTLFLGIGSGSGMNAARAHSTVTHAVEEIAEHVEDNNYTPVYMTKPLWDAIIHSHVKGADIPMSVSSTTSHARWDWPTLSTKMATVSGNLTMSKGDDKPYTAVVVQQHNGRWVMTSLHVGEES